MIIKLYNLNEDEMKLIEELEQKEPEIVVKTVLAGYDAGSYTEIIFSLAPDIIQALGAIISTFIIAHATVKSARIKSDAEKANKAAAQEDDKGNLSPNQKKKIIVRTDDGKEIEINTVEDLRAVFRGGAFE